MLQLKMAKYRQIRDEKQNCFCGIYFLGFLGKHPRNICLSTYIFNVYFGGGGRHFEVPQVNVYFSKGTSKMTFPPTKVYIKLMYTF